MSTIHCTAPPRGWNTLAAAVSAMDVARFGQISYHHVIELDGRDVQTLRYDQRGAHVGGHNTGNIGISYVGKLEADVKTPADTRTAAQRAALEHRVRELLKAYPKAIVRGHRDWSPDRNGNGRIEPAEWLKSCPCFDVAAWLREVGL